MRFGRGIGASFKTRVSKEVRLLGITLTIPQRAWELDRIAHSRN